MYFHHFPISSRGRQHPPSGRNAAGGVLQVIDQLAGKLHGKVLAAPCQCMVVVGTRMSTPGQKKMGLWFGRLNSFSKMVPWCPRWVSREVAASKLRISSPAAGILKPSNIFLILPASAGAEASWQLSSLDLLILCFSLPPLSLEHINIWCYCICRLSFHIDDSWIFFWGYNYSSSW